MLFDVKTLPPKDLAPVLARSHLLSQWESLARLYHNYYENRKEGLYQTLDNYQASPFTRNRAFSRWFPQFQKIQIFSYAQLLGEISDQEIQFANKALGGRTLGHNQRDPALLQVPSNKSAIALSCSFGVAAYAFFVLKFNKLWLGLPLLSAISVSLFQYSNQPHTYLLNAYRFIAERRAASVWYDLQQKEVEGKLAKGPGMDTLKKHLNENQTNLIQLDCEVAALVRTELLKSVK